jgi:hypothetical protein
MELRTTLILAIDIEIFVHRLYTGTTTEIFSSDSSVVTKLLRLLFFNPLSNFDVVEASWLLQLHHRWLLST